MVKKMQIGTMNASMNDYTKYQQKHSYEKNCKNTKNNCKAAIAKLRALLEYAGNLFMKSLPMPRK